MAEKAKKYDLLFKNVRVVRPRKNTVDDLDIAVKGGKIVKLAAGLDATDAKEVVDGQGSSRFRASSIRTCTRASMDRSPKMRAARVSRQRKGV